MKKVSRLLLSFLFALLLFATNLSVIPGLPGAESVPSKVEAAAKVKLSKTKMSLYIKQSATLKLKNAKGKVTWSSSNKKIAKVTSKGKITAIKKGSVKITAKNGKKKYTCKVTVLNPTISATRLNLKTGKTASLKVTGATGKVTWVSSNASVASVNANGTVKAVKAGKANITATASGIKLICAVTVTDIEVTAVTLDCSEASLSIGEEMTVKASVAPADATNPKVTWTSGDPDVATVEDGKITAIAKGETEITATAGKKSATLQLTVLKPVTGIDLAAEELELAVGDTYNLHPTVLPEDASVRSYKTTSSDPSVATVDKNGLVTAVKDGNAIIKVTAEDDSSITKTCKIAVKTRLVSITADSDDDSGVITLEKGKTAQISYTTVPAGLETTASYTSTNTKIATVDEDGLITAVSSGSTTIGITATDTYGTQRDTTLTVNVITHVESLTLNQSDTTLYVGNTLTLNPTVLPADANNKKVKYSSSDDSVATVDDSGTVKAIAAGKATITASSDDVASISQGIEITVEEVSEDSQAVVTDADGLEKALENENLQLLYIRTEDAISLTIPEGSYPNVSLIVDAPQGHIENHATFKDITIKAISQSTFVEYAEGNTINYEASTGSIEVGDGAVTTINVLSGAGDLNLNNDGTITALNVSASGTDITISGDSSQLGMEVNVASTAQDTSLTTAVDLNVSAETAINLEIRSGGENTAVTIDTADSMPSVSGLGQIEVRVSDTNKTENIVADSSGVVSTESYAVHGVITAPEDLDIAGTTLYVIPYSSAITSANITEYLSGEGVVTASVAEDGSYETEAASIGNYYIYYKAEGCKAVIMTLIMVKESDAQKNITLVSDVEGTGSVAGSLVDAQSGKPVDAGLTVYIREGAYNVSGTAYAQTMTDEEGNFRFADLPLGQYTIQVVDEREDTEGYYVSSSFNMLVDTEGENTVSNSLTKVLASDQVRFVLT